MCGSGGRFQSIVPFGRCTLLGRTVVQKDQEFLSSLNVDLKVMVGATRPCSRRNDPVQDVTDLLFGRSEGGGVFGKQGDKRLEYGLQLTVRAALVVDIAQAGGDEGGQ